jgi:hypothetical protein
MGATWPRIVRAVPTCLCGGSEGGCKFQILVQRERDDQVRKGSGLVMGLSTGIWANVHTRSVVDPLTVLIWTSYVWDT